MDDQEQAKRRRSQIMGRAILIFFGLLLAVYFVPMFWGLIAPAKN